MIKFPFLKIKKNSNYIKSTFITADFTPMKQQRNKRVRDQLKEITKGGN